MPIDVWNFHMYNEWDYSVATITEPVTSFINFVRQTRGYTTQPIWLTEWGKLGGWLNPHKDPNLPGYRGNATPDDFQHPQMANLMRDWATWMQQDNKIARWFWFDTMMGDWNYDFEFDQTGWLFQEATSFYTGTTDVGTVSSTVFGVPSPSGHTSWTGALFEALNQKTTVIGYDPSYQSVTLSPPITNLLPNLSYKIFKSDYPPTLPLNALGVAYMYFCNPGVFPNHVYLPLILMDGASSDNIETSFWDTAMPQVDVFASPLTTPNAFASPLPTPTPTPSNRLVIDDFEYDDAPTNHGWYMLRPLGELSTLTYKFDSHKLMTSIQRGAERDFAFTYPGDPRSGQTLGTNLPFLSFQFADYDGWWISADIRGSDGQDYSLLYKPEFGQPTIKHVGQQYIVQYNLGEGYLDNQWHDFDRNLAVDLAHMASGVQLQTVNRLTFSGQKFLDNIVLSRAPVPEDVAPPHVEINLNGKRNGDGRFLSPVEFTAIADDGVNGSGVSEIFVRVDGRSWLRNIGLTSILEHLGPHVLEVYATDKAGNMSDVKTVRMQIQSLGR
jgi:hypothetical protein